MTIKKLIIAVLTVMLMIAAVPVVCAAAETGEDDRDYELYKIKDTWESLSDEELNDYIGNNSEADLYWFIVGLSDKEREILKSRDTMLNNTVSADNEDGTFSKTEYYDWIMDNQSSVMPSRLRASTRNIVSQFTSDRGYCFFRFEDEDSGYITLYKVTFKLSSTSNAESDTNNYTVSSVLYKTSGTNTNKTALDQVTFAKQKKYMQKAHTIYEELGDGKTGEDEDGNTIYRTAITPVFVLTVKVEKPAYTYGGWSVNGFKSQGSTQTLAEGSRMNFREYNWENTGETTFNAGVYRSGVTDTLTANVNILSCGFTTENTDPALNLDYTPENDTINVIYKHPVLNMKFYAGGGSVSKTSSNPDAANPVERTISYNDVYDSTYGLWEPSTLGYSKTGHKPVSGKEWRNSDGSLIWNSKDTTYTAYDLQDFTEGEYFTTKKRSLYANWEPVIYKVTLDNQGAEYSGTEKTWYRYNTYTEETLDDGSVQKNYFFTTDTMVTPLKYGYQIVKPTKEGYVFKGYFSEKNGQGTQYVKENGSFYNGLWKTVGPHTLYACWEEVPIEYGELTIRAKMNKSDYYSAHGNTTFLFRVKSKDDESKVYYKSTTFRQDDMTRAENGVATQETTLVLPVGDYTVESMPVFRYEILLTEISAGEITSLTGGEFSLNSNVVAVTAVFTGSKDDWQRFSHNDIAVNQLQ